MLCRSWGGRGEEEEEVHYIWVGPAIAMPSTTHWTLIRFIILFPFNNPILTTHLVNIFLNLNWIILKLWPNDVVVKISTVLHWIRFLKTQIIAESDNKKCKYVSEVRQVFACKIHYELNTKLAPGSNPLLAWDYKTKNLRLQFQLF